MSGPSHTGLFAAVSVGTSAVQIVAPKTLRRSVLIQNVHASNAVYVGLSSSVTTSNGIKLGSSGDFEVGDSMVFSDYNGAVWAIASGASTDVRYLEVGGS